MFVCLYVNTEYIKNIHRPKINIDQMAIQKVQTSNGIRWFNK